MKKVVAIIFILIILVAASYLLINNTTGKKSVKNNPQATDNASNNTEIQPGKPLTNGIKAARWFTISMFADKVPDARDEQFTPGGTLLVSSPQTGQVYALPDKHNDGVADDTKVIISGENQPHGLAFYNNKLYVADNDKVVRFTWDEQSLTATKEKTVLSIPAGGDHSLRTIIFDQNGRMFVSIGSTCNVCLENNSWLGTIVTADADGNNARIFAKGLRNAPFMALHISDNTIWSTEMGRDYLGDNIPPDEIDIIQDGKDYGWPYCYGNRIYDSNFGKQSAAYCQRTISPVFEILAHSAPLGLTFISSSQFPSDWQGDLLVSYHGSWNRTVKSGYKVVRLHVSGNAITGADDFITGFLQGSDVVARPVDLSFGKDGSLYVSDDKTGAVYRVTKSR